MAIDIGKIDFGSAIAVGPPKNLSDGVHTEFTGGNMGQLMTADIWGKYGEFCRRGWVYTASGTLLTIPVYTTLTNGPALWNPAGSGKLVVPLKILLSAGGLGTPVITGLVGCFLNGAGSTAATGAPVITWTNILPIGTNLGKQGVASTMFANAVVTYTTQPAAFYHTGLNMWKSGTDAISLPISLYHEFDGAVQLQPGSLIAFGGTPAATSTTYIFSIMFAEIPLLVS
jgi:hypothetical protein